MWRSLKHFRKSTASRTNIWGTLQETDKRAGNFVSLIKAQSKLAGKFNHKDPALISNNTKKKTMDARLNLNGKSHA